MDELWLSADEFKQHPDAAKAVRKYGTLAKLDEMAEPRRLRFVVSTGDVDRDNDTIDPNGWELANFKNNPVVLWAHDHRGLPIARAVEIGVEGNQLVAVAEFATHAFAQTVFDLLKGGFLRATSVGFRALEYAINEERRGVDFKRQELMEFSVCPVPANPMALIAASAAGVDLEPVRQWMAGLLAEWPGELVLPGKAWEKVLGAAAKQVGQETPVKESAAGAVTATVTVDTTQLDAAIGKFDALLVRLDAANQAVAQPRDAAAETVVQPDPQLQGDPANDDDAELLADGDGDVGDVLDIDPEPEDETVTDVSAAELADLLKDVVAGAMGAVVREETTRALNKIRGRID